MPLFDTCLIYINFARTDAFVLKSHDNIEVSHVLALKNFFLQDSLFHKSKELNTGLTIAMDTIS